jgi:hypothetical protein
MSEDSWIETALRRVGELPDDKIVLAEAALLCALDDRPEIDPERYRRHLVDLVRTRPDKIARMEVDSPAYPMRRHAPGDGRALPYRRRDQLRRSRNADRRSSTGAAACR